MAINPSTNGTMTGRVTAADANYPYASAKDESSPGAGDGSPYFKARADDIFGFQQALLEAANITPSGNADTALVSEYMQAIVELSSGRADNYDESGAVNVYVLDVRTNQQAPRSLFDDLSAWFTPGTVNTGASTVNVATLGAKAVVDINGQALTGGELVGKVNIRYNLANDNWVLHGNVPLELQAQLKSGRKNPIINGGFDIWQRDTSQTASGYGSDDRWDNAQSGSTKTHSQQAFTLGQTDVLGNPEFYSRTVVTSSAGASNFVNKNQRIEGVKNFSGEIITISFDAKTDSAKDIATEFVQDFGTGGSPSADVTAIGATTHSLTTSWQRFETTVLVPSIAGKTIGSNIDDDLSLIFWFDAGSDFDARTNSLGQQSGTFDIANVQVEKGTIATDFEQLTLGEIQNLCYRYFWRLIHGDIANEVAAPVAITSTTAGRGIMLFPVEMRATPTLSISAAADFDLQHGATTTPLTTLTFVTATKRSGSLSIGVAAGLTAGNAGWLRGDATLNARLDFDAEL